MQTQQKRRRASLTLRGFALFISICWATTSESAIHVVSPDGTGDFPTIADAVAAAVTGDTVELTDGVFTGPGNRDILISGIQLTVRSQSGSAASTTIDCEANAAFRRRGFLLESAELRLENVRIRNGFAPGTADESSGGAIRSIGSVVDVSGCIFSQNNARHLQLSTGGAILADGGELRIKDSIFSQNESHGPGQAIRAVSLQAPLDLSGSIFEQSTQGWDLVRAEESSAIVRDCGFFNASAEGLRVYSADSVHVTDCEFRDNGDYGLFVQECANFKMEDCLFHLTTPVWHFYQGALISDATGVIERTDFRGMTSQSAALSLNSCSMEIRDCLVDGNSGLWTGGIFANDGSVLVERCTVTRNFGATQGGALRSFSDNVMTVRNSVIWGNCSSSGLNDVTEAADISFECTVVDPEQVPVDVTFIGPPIVSDPLFCGPVECDSAAVVLGDYTVSASSPCLPENNVCGVPIGARGQGCGPLGACCLPDGSCVIETQESCDTVGGAYLGDATTCDDSPCQSLGACCSVLGACTIQSDEMCLAASGLFLGDGTICDAPCNGNNGGVLVLHTEPGVLYTPDETSYCGNALPSRCEEVNARIDGLETRVVCILALFDPESPSSVAGVTFGLDYDTDDILIVDSGSCGDFQFPSAEWPAPGSGTQVFWNDGQSGSAVEAVWLAPYSYSGGSSLLSLVPHPEHGAFFQDDSVPSVAVPIFDLGSLGFSTDGQVPCPASPGGACCQSDASCELRTAADCAGIGVFFGAGSTCEPDPCDPASAVVATPERDVVQLRVKGPSPGFGPIEVDLYNPSGGRDIRVEWMDASGRRMGSAFTVRADAGWSRHELDLEDQLPDAPAGVYFLRADSESRSSTARVVRVR